ncbi:ABC transporter permease [Persicirhabdus sediminis]|uniref:ABC transporter permease n=1 Tax=Persicirhabdus sediminis TaxID=454144 RepID=A0A8J7MDB7_9BACT|nr:ABC transporter permease [Persicirhabdus sediminis]MBK1790507.1 ABC transporter permease [Persicirhabdus sediminis]
MFKTILSRLGQGILVVFCLISITFFLVRMMPGDPLTDEKALPPHIIEKNKAYYHLDKPLPVQYLYYFKNLAQGDLGDSMSKDRPVVEIIGSSFPVSLILGISSMLIALAVGIPAGVIAALRKNSFIDYASMSIAMLGICIPAFVVGPLLAMYIASNVSFLKVAGWGGPFDWILPAITLGLTTAAYLARITRGGMLEVLNQDYIRTAKAKGLPTHRIITRHALRGGLIPAVAYVGPAFAALISGSFIVETIFQIPGLGQHFINGATSRDYNILQGVVFLYGVIIVIANLAADIALAMLNPRARESA